MLMTSMDPVVSIIVVTWNARDHIDACLDAICLGATGVPHEVLVVDNDSGDETVTHVRANWPDVRVLETGRNGGMAAGNNAGMLAAHASTAEFFLLCNSDAYLHEGTLAQLLATARERHDVAAVVPRLVNVDGSPQRSVRGFPTFWRFATEFLLLRQLARGSRAVDAFYGGGVDLSATRTIDWATGACLLVPRAAVDAVGLLDETYFMYGEELDWLRRMSRTGLRVWWEPRAVATHVGGGSSSSTAGALYQRQLANHVRYVARNEDLRAARRTRLLLVWALRLRAAGWRVASLVAGSSGRALRRRGAAFAAGARTVRAVDPRAPGEPEIPSWPGLQQPHPAAR